MGIRPILEIAANELAGRPKVSIQPRANLPVVIPPQQMATVPAPFVAPATTWGAKRQARHYRALEDLTNAQTGYLRARAELAKAFIAAARQANEVAELPEICASDTEVRRLHRERDFLNARTEVEQARYGLYATQDEVDKRRKPRMKKALNNNAAAIDALMKAKVDMEALGEDTRGLDETLSILQHS